jgi:hypothetical protein
VGLHFFLGILMASDRKRAVANAVIAVKKKKLNSSAKPKTNTKTIVATIAPRAPVKKREKTSSGAQGLFQPTRTR